MQNADSAQALNTSGSGMGKLIWTMGPNGRMVLADVRQEMERLSPGLKFGWEGLPFFGNLTQLQKPTNGSLYRVHHSSLAKGAPVAGAGEMSINQGQLTDLDGESGHFRPNNGFLCQAVRELWRKGVDLNAANINLRLMDGPLMGYGWETMNIRNEFEKHAPDGTMRSPPAWERLLGYGPGFIAKGGEIENDMKEQTELRNNLFTEIRTLGNPHFIKNDHIMPSMRQEMEERREMFDDIKLLGQAPQFMAKDQILPSTVKDLYESESESESESDEEEDS